MRFFTTTDYCALAHITLLLFMFTAIKSDYKNKIILLTTLLPSSFFKPLIQCLTTSEVLNCLLNGFPANDIIFIKGKL